MISFLLRYWRPTYLSLERVYVTCFSFVVIHFIIFTIPYVDTHKQQYLQWNGLIGESFPYTIKCTIQLYECILSSTSLNNSIGGTRDFHVTRKEPSALAGAVYPVIEENEVQYYKNGHLNTVDKLNHKFNKKILYNITGLSYFACWYHN